MRLSNAMSSSSVAPADGVQSKQAFSSPAGQRRPPGESDEQRASQLSVQTRHAFAEPRKAVAPNKVVPHHPQSPKASFQIIVFSFPIPLQNFNLRKSEFFIALCLSIAIFGLST